MTDFAPTPGSDDQATKAAQLIEARPDLAEPAPDSYDQLLRWSRRAVHRNHAQQHQNRLVSYLYQLISMLANAKPHERQIVGVNEILALVEAPETVVRKGLESLSAEQFISIEAGDVIAPVSPLAIFETPCGLGPTAIGKLSDYVKADLIAALNLLGLHQSANTPKDRLIKVLSQAFEDRDQIKRLIANAPDDVRNFLETTAHQGPAVGAGPRSESRRDVNEWYRQSVPSVRRQTHGYLAKFCLISPRTAPHFFQIPREITLALRGNYLLTAAMVTEPEIPPAPEPKAELRATPIIVDLIASLGQLCAVNDIRLQKSNTFSANAASLKVASESIGLSTETIAYAIKMARNVQYFYAVKKGGEEDGSLHMATTENYRQWLDLRAGDRWLALLPNWLDVRKDQDEDGPDWDCRRDEILGVIAKAPGLLASTEALLNYLRYQAPTLFYNFDETHLASYLSEATLWGIINPWGLTVLGRALLANDFDEAVAGLNAGDSATVQNVTVQSNGVIVVPGRPEATMFDALSLFTRVESQSAATTLRLDPTSLRAAFDTGMTNSAIHQILASYASNPIPQPVTYLIDDEWRRHGQIEVGTTSTYLKCDPANLAEIMRSSRVKSFQLTQLSDSVAVSTLTETQLLAALRKAGFAPRSSQPPEPITKAPPRRRLSSRPAMTIHPPHRLRHIVTSADVHGVVATIAEVGISRATLEAARTSAWALTTELKGASQRVGSPESLAILTGRLDISVGMAEAAERLKDRSGHHDSGRTIFFAGGDAPLLKQGESGDEVTCRLYSVYVNTWGQWGGIVELNHPESAAGRGFEQKQAQALPWVAILGTARR